LKRSPLSRKRAKPRRQRLPRCEVRGCSRIARFVGLCKTHATKRADIAISRIVRSRPGPCEATKLWDGAAFDCSGPFHCCHLISRMYRGTRWDLDNVVKMCASHHAYFDRHPVERENTILLWLGASRWRDLKRKAIDPALDWQAEMVKILEEASDETKQ
jgi:hypothetical protein